MDWHEERMLVIAAKMYYEDSLTQSEIADRLGIYRTTITRMLQKARDEGIVRIEIKGSERVRVDIEQKINKRFGLKDSVVVPIEEEAGRTAKLETLGKAANSLLDSIIADGDTVGLAWGETLGTMADVIENVRKKDAVFVPLVGGPGKMRVEHHVNTIVYNFAKAYKAKSQYIDSAAIVQSKKIRDDILYSGYMQDVTNLWKQLSIAVIGIGAPIRSSNLVWAGFLDNGEDKLLEDEKIIGDVCSRFYTIDGRETTSELKDRAVAIELDALKETKATIAVAESEEKIHSILGALRGGYISHFVTDEKTAIALLEVEE